MQCWLHHVAEPFADCRPCTVQSRISAEKVWDVECFRHVRETRELQIIPSNAIKTTFLELRLGLADRQVSFIVDDKYLDWQIVSPDRL